MKKSMSKKKTCYLTEFAHFDLTRKIVHEINEKNICFEIMSNHKSGVPGSIFMTIFLFNIEFCFLSGSKSDLF